MEFAKYYNVTDKLNSMLEEDNKLFSYTKDYCQGLYICMDTNDFWISRILEGYNEDFEQEEGKWLVEREKIDKYEFIEFIEERLGRKYNKIKNRADRDYIIDNISTKHLIENLILMDDDKGLESWDNCEADSLEEAIEIIDGGFGIIEYKEVA